MAYIDYSDYTTYLAGRTAVIPEPEFNYWAEEASGAINNETYGRLSDAEILQQYEACVKRAACKLAEFMYNKETRTPAGNREVKSEKVFEYSVTYEDAGALDAQYNAVLSGLDYCNGISTGLRYRGITCEVSPCCTPCNERVMK